MGSWDILFSDKPIWIFSHRGNDDKPTAREDDLGIKSIFRPYSILASQGHQQIWLKRAVPKPGPQGRLVPSEGGQSGRTLSSKKFKARRSTMSQANYPIFDGDERSSLLKKVQTKDDFRAKKWRCVTLSCRIQGATQVVFSTEATNQTIQIINESDGERKRDLYQYGALWGLVPSRIPCRESFWLGQTIPIY